MRTKYPKNVLTLISFLNKLPGVGIKTAQRFAFELFKWEKTDLASFGDLISSIKEKIKKCPVCGCLLENTCDFCKRESHQLCILSCSKDVYFIEDLNTYQGYYHIFPLISPMHGFFEDKENIEKLIKRIKEKNIKEVIIALDSTLEGDATALYLKNNLKGQNMSISRLAFGLPIGSSLEYIDNSTLSKAFLGRQNF